MAASAPTTIRPMSRKTAAAWPKRWASRRRIFSPCYQIHSPDVVVATGAVAGRSRPRADAHGDAQPKASRIGVTAADCGPVLFADPAARVIGAAHAGWKGALTGVLESTVDAMEKLGADRGGIVAAIGPLIRQHELRSRRRIRRTLSSRPMPSNARFFIPSARDGHAMFDLAGFIRMRLENAGVLMIDDIGIDTYSDERFFSYRRSVHRKEPDYGRHIHAIVLEIAERASEVLQSTRIFGIAIRVIAPRRLCLALP